MTCPLKQPQGSPCCHPSPQHLSCPGERSAIAAYPWRRGFSSLLLSPRLSPTLSCSVKVKLVSQEPPLPVQPLPWHCAGASGSGSHYGCRHLPSTSYTSLTMKEPRGFSHQAQGFLQVRSPPAPSLEQSLRSDRRANADRGTHPAEIRQELRPAPSSLAPSLPPPAAFASQEWGNTPHTPVSCRPQSASPTQPQLPPRFPLKTLHPTRFPQILQETAWVEARAAALACPRGSKNSPALPQVPCHQRVPAQTLHRRAPAAPPLAPHAP